ncbi:MAG: hypothetical protein KKH94_02230 [Candidatus Omnitrophica bacterium]|nr:hypothetical protein [Candidatus Omnitrophota bacterium]
MKKPWRSRKVLLLISILIGFYFIVYAQNDQWYASDTGPADLAEKMPLSTHAMTAQLKPNPGELVVIDSEGFIRKSMHANSHLVVGIVSTKPAHTLRSMIKESVPVALSGLVPCKIISENGLIKPGDLIVSSSKPGYAMKAPAQILPGTVVGKAIGTQENDEDVVLVLVMMR